MPIPVDELLSADILKPARYLGNELGAVHKPWEAAKVRWVLSYPEIYEIGASNVGHIILYNILNTMPDQLCDRVYLPGADLAHKLRTTQTPLFAVESRRPLREFDLIGFSLSYELGATNILEMLDLAGLPLTWAERQGATDLPLIFAGGQTATSNPEPYADFFDFFAIGDGEELLPEIGLVVAEAKQAGLSRQALLLDLAQIPGVYVPQFYDRQPDGAVIPNRPDVPQRILRRVAKPLPTYAIGLVPYVQTVHDRLTVEIRRGCTRGCRFCQPGMLTRPARDVAPEEVISAIETGMRATGYNEFSLLSLSCSDYLALPAVGVEIKNRLQNESISLSLPSQRVDRFDENIAHIVGGTRQSGLTFAPEAGTQRLRDIINKGLTNEELLRGIKTAYEQGWDKVKLYFMIGLPGETDADVLGIAETIRWLKRECSIKGRKPLHFNLTISNFTPKPHTPFQWHAVSTAEFERKQALLKAEFRTIGGLKANFTDVRISAMEDFIGRGDRQLGAVVRRAWELGAREDSWWENLDRAYAAWTQAIAEAGLDWKYRQLQAGEWDVFSSHTPALDAPLPWDHIDTGISKAWLKEDLQRALAAVVVPDCSFAGCSHCGVCGIDFGHNVVVPPPPMPAIQKQSPPQERVQRVRLTFGKQGSMTLIGHLDLLRLLERAVRRAQLPIAFSSGFHPLPRIATASALPLGMASRGEIVDLEFYQPVDPEEVLSRLRQQLPEDLPLYSCEVVPLRAPAASQALVAATYELLIHSPDSLSQQVWENILATLRATAEVPYTLTTKSGNSQVVNLRDRLLEIELSPEQPDWPMVRLIYKGVCRNDGTFLRPEHCLHLLEVVSGYSLELRHVTRQQLHLDSSPNPSSQARDADVASGEQLSETGAFERQAITA